MAIIAAGAQLLLEAFLENELGTLVTAAGLLGTGGYVATHQRHDVGHQKAFEYAEKSVFKRLRLGHPRDEPKTPAPLTIEETPKKRPRAENRITPKKRLRTNNNVAQPALGEWPLANQPNVAARRRKRRRVRRN